MNGAEAAQDTPDVPLRPSERKRLHWNGLTCGCPLCNKRHFVKCYRRSRSSDHCRQSGAQTITFEDRKSDYKIKPFRQLCVSLGADITCGESKRLLLTRAYVSSPLRSGSRNILPPRLKRRVVSRPSSPVRTNFRRPTSREQTSDNGTHRRDDCARVWTWRWRYGLCRR
jgi:hypothetical protein